ncbi:MAG: LysR substrate-binding domain-containing protein [Planctomycetota bacterium]
MRLRLESGSLEELLKRLANHGLDVVLSNVRPATDADRAWRCRRIAMQPVSLIGHRRRDAFRFPEDLHEVALILPGRTSDIRTEFDAVCAQLRVPVRIAAEVDDMATMRLLARDTEAVALLPSVVVRDELRTGQLHEYCEVPGLLESFYAITVERRFQHPLLLELFAREGEEILATAPGGDDGGTVRIDAD